MSSDASSGTPAPDHSTRDSALAALARCRHEIEQIDRELVAILAKRVGMSREIGSLKKIAGLPTLDPAREAEVIRRAATLARDAGLSDEKVRDIFWHVIGLSRAVQVDE
jgi:chorismate mutase